MMQRVAAVVLAAGASSRLGRPKQLLLYQGVPLVASVARAALEAGADPVVVVLGAEMEAVGAALSGIPVIPVVNPAWKRGMGTSVATGVRSVVHHAPSVDAVLITLADQPLVGDAALGRLLEAWISADTGSSDGGSHPTIAAAAYAGSIGVPAVFGREHFDALCSLPDAAGAAGLLREEGVWVRRVALSEAALDVDTPNDVERLRGGAGARLFATPITRIS